LQDASEETYEGREYEKKYGRTSGVRGAGDNKKREAQREHVYYSSAYLDSARNRAPFCMMIHSAGTMSRATPARKEHPGPIPRAWKKARPKIGKMDAIVDRKKSLAARILAVCFGYDNGRYVNEHWNRMKMPGM